MKKLLIVLIVLCGVFTAWGSAFPQCSSGCYPTNFPATPTTANPALCAALVNPTGTVNATINATGCDVGVYYGPGNKGFIEGANISGATYFGVLVNGASVSVLDSNISNIGPLSNTFGNIQYRPVGIFYLNGDKPHHHKIQRNKIEGNTITLPTWGKGGIVAKNPGTVVEIKNNTIKGSGLNSGIAQNGIEIGDGAQADIAHNTVESNQYTGTDTNATGILIYGGPGFAGLGVFEGPNYTGNVNVHDNILTNNDVGVYLSNMNIGQLIPSRTWNVINHNQISNDNSNPNIFNTGIAYASGHGDTISENTIYGKGY